LVLDSKRRSVDFLLDPIAKRLVRVNAHHLSLLSLAFAAASGLAVFLSPQMWILLPLASLLMLANGFLDALDGKVARLTGTADKRGDFLDHVIDRYADVLMIGGVAVSAWCNPYIGMVALVGVLLTSYMGTQAQAVGAGRLYAGLLGRADRIVLLIAAPLLQLAASSMGSGWIGFGPISLSVFEIVMLWFGIVGNLTAVQRAVTTWRSLR
jgi:archaetidylinositol phosphate synthase